MMENKKYISDKIYKEIVANVPISCVDIIFLNKKRDKTLLFKRNNKPAKNVYFTIGGRLLKGESFLHGAVRQAKRELGLKINPKKTIFAGITEDFHKSSIFKGISYHAIVIFFVYVLEDEDIKIKFDTQHSCYKWFSIRDKTIHSHIKERIRQISLVLKK